MRFISLLPLAATVFLAAPAAFASAPTDRVYGGAAGSVQKEIEGGGALPFSGFDLVLLFVGGLLLLVTGLVLRRATRRAA
jgi:hypothetical protein